MEEEEEEEGLVVERVLDLEGRSVSATINWLNMSSSQSSSIISEEKMMKGEDSREIGEEL
jgi:hypothetical protein